MEGAGLFLFFKALFLGGPLPDAAQYLFHRDGLTGPLPIKNYNLPT
jgi:hypothetical protein